MLQVVETKKGEIINIIHTYKSISNSIELKARNKIEKLRNNVKYRDSNLIYIEVWQPF